MFTILSWFRIWTEFSWFRLRT